MYPAHSLWFRNVATSGTTRIPYLKRRSIHGQLHARPSYGLLEKERSALRWYGRHQFNKSTVSCDSLYTLPRTSQISLSFGRALSLTCSTRLLSSKTLQGPSLCSSRSLSSISSEAAANTSVGGGDEEGFELVYKGPLRSAVRAVKVFSLSTCAIALVGGPILVMMGNPSVPLIGRILMTTFVMTVGISTTLILHWLMKGYVIEMYFDPKSEQLRVYTLTMFAGKRCHTFHVSEAGPPDSLTAFSTFQAQGKSYFMHTEVWENKELLGKILGAYMALENSELWDHDKTKTETLSSKEHKT